jgi:hypothetical protein
MSTRYVLFPDSREPEGTVEGINKEMRSARELTGHSRAFWHTRFHSADPSYPERLRWYDRLTNDEDVNGFVAWMRTRDWRYPALLVYQTIGDGRWSYVMVGLSSPEGGEGDGHRDPSFLDGL